MGELGLNKIFGSILAAALVVMGLQSISAAVFSSGGHHGHHGEEKPYAEAIKDKYAYWTEVAVASEGDVDEGPRYDLGLLLASADPTRGERVFGSVCASCHTINEGGANGTGPNLYGLVDRDIAGVASFGYSSALSGVDGGWTYAALDNWIVDPQAFARGSNMVANVKRDTDRANLIAYLAQNTPNASAFPAPLPEEGEAPAEGEPVAEEDVSAESTPAEGSVISEEEGEEILDEMEEIVERMEDSVDRLDEIIPDAEDTVTEAVEDTVETAEGALQTDIVDEVVETVEDGVEGLEMPSEPELPAEQPEEAVER